MSGPLCPGRVEMGRGRDDGSLEAEIIRKR